MKPSRQAAVRQKKYSGKNTFTIHADTAGLEELIADMKTNVQAAIRPAAQAAAEVLYQAVLQNVDAIGSKTGNLRNSIYQAFSEENSHAAGAGYAKATYHVSWNAKEAPHGHLIEHGYMQRYEYYQDDTGQVHPRPKPENVGKVPPWKQAGLKRPRPGEAERWYVAREGGPVQVPARSFVRKAADRFPAAVEAAKQKLLDALEAT
jgi:hypothetical protein